MSQPPEPEREEATLASSPGNPEANEFSPEERTLLLKLAHEAIESRLEGREFSLQPPTLHLAEPRGVFTTLYFQANLRGCVGYVFPVTSLYQTVIETARASAFEDNRFPSVTREEAPHLSVSLSILSRLQPIAADQIEVGRHGLLVTMAGRRGLLLPQVPVERRWDRAMFLEQTCRKAGLSLDAWQTGAKLEAFTAEVFSESRYACLDGT